MQAIKPKESRSEGYAQESAKTDGMSKGGSVGGGGENGRGRGQGDAPRRPGRPRGGVWRPNSAARRKGVVRIQAFGR